MDKRYYDYITITPPIFFKFKMNRIVLIFSALALFAACEKYEDEIVTDGGLHAVTLPDVICASMSGDDMDPKTRTWLGGEEGKDVLWHGDDEISYFTGNIHANYVSQGTGDSSVEFIQGDKEQAAVEFAVDGTVAIYPYDSYNDPRIVEGKNVIYTMFPSIQTYAQDSFGKGANVMVAKSETAGADNLYFRNACGYLVIKLYGADTAVKSIVLSSRSGLERISGSAYVSVDQSKDPEVTMTNFANTTITLDCSNGGEGVQLGVDKEHATEFWFALPPVRFEEGLTIVVTDMRDRSYVKSTAKPVTVTRNNVQPMAAQEFEQNDYASTDNNKIWYKAEAKLNFDYEGAQIPWFNTEIKSHEWVEEKNLYCIEFYGPLERIGREAFRGDVRGAELQYIVLPDGLAIIGEGAFRDSDLFHIDIPGSVTQIHPDAFYNCQSLREIVFEPSPLNAPLYIGYSTTAGGAQIGPFYYSPLADIRLNREMIYRKGEYNSEEFTPDEEDEGIFAIEEVDEERDPTHLEIGGQVKTLHDFMFCNHPISILDLPGTLNAIGNNVFNGCTRIRHIKLYPSSEGEALTLGYNTDGEKGPFSDCPLESVSWNREIDYTLADIDLDAINEGIFSDKETLTSVTLGNQVKTLTPYLFADTGITSITIPASVTSIGEYAFDGCESLSRVEFEESPEAIEIKGQGDSDGPFYDSPLTYVGYKRNINYKKLDGTPFVPVDDTDGIFAINSGLKDFDDEVDDLVTAKYTVSISKYIEAIQDRAFCNLLAREITIPGTVNTIGNNVFNGCEDLERITFEPSPTATSLTLGYNTDDEEDGPFLDSPLVTVNLDREINYTLASGDLDATDEGVFSGKEELTTVTLGDQVKTLSDYMFTNSAFDSIDLNKVETIGKGVFMGSDLNVLTIPATLESIGVNAFVNCDNLEYLYIPDGTETLTVGIQDQNSADWGPFYDSPLKYAYLGREINYVDASGNKFTADETSDGFFASEESIDDLQIILGNNVKTISDYMFAGLNIKEITIPASVNYIGWEAFLDCEELSSVTFEDGTETITVYSQTFALRSYGPFYESPLTEVYVGREIDYEIAGTNYDDTWWALFASKKSVDKLSVTLSSNVKTIVRNMFGGCPITEITIPASVTKIQNNAFEDCTKLSRITFESSTEPLTIGYQARVDNVGPFYQSPLSYIKLDRELVPSASYQNMLDDWDMGVFSNSHYDDDDLTTEVHLGSNVKTILPWMFSGVRVHNIWIPETVTSIANSAFYDCRRLNDVTMGHHTPPAIGTGVFDSCDIFRYIVVRKSALEKYQAASDWDAYESSFYTKDDFE